jgi:hypothetical protein
MSAPDATTVALLCHAARNRALDTPTDVAAFVAGILARGAADDVRRPHQRRPPRTARRRRAPRADSRDAPGRAPGELGARSGRGPDGADLDAASYRRGGRAGTSPRRPGRRHRAAERRAGRAASTVERRGPPGRERAAVLERLEGRSTWPTRRRPSPPHDPRPGDRRGRVARRDHPAACRRRRDAQATGGTWPRRRRRAATTG